MNASNLTPCESLVHLAVECLIAAVITFLILLGEGRATWNLMFGIPKTGDE